MNTTTPRPVALITGASRGIGSAIALKLASQGFRVGVNYSASEERARAVLELVEKAGGHGFLTRFDVSDSAQVDAEFDRILKEHGTIQVLVNNAGITIDGLLLRLKDEDLDRTLNVDLKGAIYCSRAATKQMMRARGGSIIQISSVIGEMGNAGQSAYAAAKAGLIGFSKSLAREIASRGVRVNVVTPGFVATEMTSALTEAQKDAILRTIPLGFLGEPQDVANAVAFLAGNDSRYVTGQILGVNGGMYM